MTAPERPVILIAGSIADGRDWLAQHPVPPKRVITITPRSPLAARGRTAAVVLATPAAKAHTSYERLLAESLPATLAA